MRYEPTALGWVDFETSAAPDWDRAQVRRLARRLGYELIWLSDDTVLNLVDAVRAEDVDAVITPAPNHLDLVTLNRLMTLADIETACPRTSFARWAVFGAGA
ncbi:hypothetical protein [Nocardia nepalensis]|uniref:hypothetical protein n=1 Tax=Nocardia nepalensis TaxID=3375448 RepID=UPI003B67B32E